jgi:hypothetical protein
MATILPPAGPPRSPSERPPTIAPVELDRPRLPPTLGVALATAGTFLLVGSIGGLSLHQTGWIVAALGVAGLVLCGALISTSRAAPAADAKLAALVGSLALPVGVALASYGGSSPLGGGIPLGLLLQPFAMLTGGPAADAASDGLFAGAIVLLLVYRWARWARLVFAGGIEAVLGLSERLAGGAGGDGSWVRGFVLLAVGAALTSAVVTLRTDHGDLSSSLAVPAGLAALIGAILLPIADPGRLAVGPLAVAILLLLWLLELLRLAPRLGSAVVAAAGTYLLAFDLADGGHVWIAIPVLAVGALLALAPVARPDRIRP